MELIIKINVKSKGEAYKIVSELGFTHEVTEAEFEGQNETFDKENKPAYFLKDNKKNALEMRSAIDINT